MAGFITSKYMNIVVVSGFKKRS